MVLIASEPPTSIRLILGSQQVTSRTSGMNPEWKIREESGHRPVIPACRSRGRRVECYGYVGFQMEFKASLGYIKKP